MIGMYAVLKSSRQAEPEGSQQDFTMSVSHNQLHSQVKVLQCPLQYTIETRPEAYVPNAAMPW